MTGFPKAVLSAAIALVVLGLAVAAVLLTALRLALPYADHMRPQVEDSLSRVIGRDVDIGSFGVALAGFSPLITIDRLVLPRRPGDTFEPRAQRVQITLDPWETMKAAALRVTGIELFGAHLQVRRTPEDEIVVTGFEGFKSMGPGARTFLLTEGRIRGSGGFLQVVDERAASRLGSVDLSGLDLDLSNAFDSHGLRLSAAVSRQGPITGTDRAGAERDSAPGVPPALTLDLIAQLNGLPQDPAHWAGEIYLHLESHSLSELLTGLLPPQWTAARGAVSLDAWASLSDRALSRAVGRLRVADLDIKYAKLGEGDSGLHLEQLQGLWRWRPAEQGKGGRLDVADLTLCMEGGRWPATDLSLRYRSHRAGRDFALDIGGFELGALLPVVGSFAHQLPPSLWTVIEQQPRGRVHRLGLQLSQRTAQSSRWSVDAEVRGFGVAAVDRLPGIDGLDVRLRFDASGGLAELSASDSTLDLPRLFQHPLALDALSGPLRWQHNDDGLWLTTEGLCVSTADLKMQTRLRLQLPADGTSPFLNLSARFWDGQVADVRQNLPVGILKPKLRAWLDRALIDGQVTAGEVRFLGRFADYPFDGEEGHLEVRFDIEDGVLDYHPGWPRLEDIQGQVRFLNRTMRVDLASARLFDTEMTELVASIPDLFPSKVLNIDGRGSGPFADGLRALSETSLGPTFGALAAGFEVDGRSRLHLQLDVPLPRPGERPKKPDLRGELTWERGAKLSIKRSPVTLSDLSGSFVFTQESLSAERIDARLWDAPVRLELETETGPDDRLTRIGVSGSGRVATLQQRFPNPLWGRVEGSIPWQLDLSIRNSDILSEPNLPIAYRLRSDLDGVALDLPPPLGKAQGQHKTLDLSGTLILGRELSVECQLGNQNADLMFDYDSVDRMLRLKEIKAPRLQLGPLMFRDLRIESIASTDVRVLKIKTRDLEGVWTIPEDRAETPIKVHLSDLDLEGILDAGESAEVPGSKPRPDADPRQAPLLDIRVDRLRWGANDLGVLEVGTRRGPSGIIFDELSLDSDLVKVRGGGAWQFGSGRPHTSLNLVIEGRDMGAFLRQLDYESLLDQAPSKASLDLAWPGGPDALSLERLTGTFEFNIEAGTFLEVEPGVGRMLGILNMGALQRRLRLDFHDVVDEGYAFEQIEGRLRVADGQAEIERFKIEAHSADIEARGRTNLVTQQFDQTVLVTPKLGTGVALASAVAGGPLVGAAVFVVDKATGGAVDKLSRHSYRITGPWDAPLIESGGWDPGGTFIKSGGRAQSRKAAPAESEEGENLFLQ